MKKQSYLQLLFYTLLSFLIACQQPIQNKKAIEQQRERKSISAQTKREIHQQRTSSSHTSILEEVEELGPNITNRICNWNCFSGMVKEFVIDSEDENIYVMATETSGGWVSYDKGNNWEPIDDQWPGMELGWLSQSNANPDLYYFCGESPGLFIWDKTQDLGLVEWVGTIDGVPDSNFPVVTYVKNDPDDPNSHYLSTEYQLYKYENGQYRLLTEPGTNFQNWLKFGDFEIIPGEGIVINYGERFMTLKHNGEVHEYTTEIGGFFGELAISPSDPKVIYAMSYTYSDFGLFRSRNAGVDWEKLNIDTDALGSHQQSHDQTLEIYKYDDNYDMIIGGVVSLWMCIVENNHLDQQPLIKRLWGPHPDYHGTHMTDEELFIYNDGGIFGVAPDVLDSYYNPNLPSVETRNDAISYTTGLNTLQATDIAYHKQTGNFAFGLYHNGSWLNKWNGSTANTNGGDGFDSAFHPTNQNIVYSSLQANNFYRYNIANGQSEKISDLASSSSFATTLFTHASVPDAVFYLGIDGLMSIPDATTCLNLMCVPVQNIDIDRPRGIRVDLNSDNDITYLYNDEKVLLIPTLLQNISIQIFALNEPFVFEKIQDVFVRSTEEGEHVYVLVKIDDSEYQIHELLIAQGQNNHLSTRDISLKEGVEVNNFIASANNSYYVIGTNVGLHYLFPDDNTPKPNLNIPAVEIMDIEYHEDLNTVFLATYGRGIWKGNLKDTVSMVSSITDLEVENNIQVYPNPFDEVLHVESKLASEVILLNSSGQVLDRFTTKKNQTIERNYDYLKPGLYWLLDDKSGDVKTIIKH